MYLFIHSSIHSLTQHASTEPLCFARKPIYVSLRDLQDAFTERSYEIASLPIPAEAEVTQSKQEADCPSQSLRGTEAPLNCRNKPELAVWFEEGETEWEKEGMK